VGGDDQPVIVGDLGRRAGGPGGDGLLVDAVGQGGEVDGDARMGLLVPLEESHLCLLL
jgi:hypothetical protein